MHIPSLVEIFPTLATYPGLRKELEEKGNIMEFPKGEVILKEGAYVKVLPLLLSGLIKVFKEEENGNEVLLYYIKPGESCVMSMTSVIQGNMSKVKAVIEEDCTVIVLPAADARKIAEKYPNWNAFMYDLFSSKYDELIQVIKTLTFSTKQTRLIDYLRKEAEHKGSNLIHKTHQLIGEELGSSREVISRLLKKMEHEGIVKIGLGWVELTEE